MKFKYAVLVMLFLSTTLAVYAQDGLNIKIVETTNYYSKDNPVNLTVTLQNTSAQPIKVLKYFTPINGIEEDILSLSLNGSSKEYIGRHFRRRAPLEEDYVVIRPQETISGNFPLLDNYDISQTGRYTVKFNTQVFNKKTMPSERWGTPTVYTNTVYLYIEGREPPEEPREEEEGEDDEDGETAESRGGFQNKFRSCSSSEKNTLITARNNAITYSDGAYAYLLAGIVDNTYTTWFGAFDQTRYDAITEDFRKTSEDMSGEKFIFKCRNNGCGGGAWAWVRRKREYRIHICPAFFSELPAVGKTSQADTIVHEVTHFKDVADTDDDAYGEDNSKQLAIDSPNQAADNADNFAFFSVDAGMAGTPCVSPTSFCGKYRAHVRSIGWLDYVGNLVTAGTTGQGRRMEAAQIDIDNMPAGADIQYRAHVKGHGWLGWVGNGGVAGTTGESRRMEAIQIKFINAPSNCHVFYRAHVKGHGWLSWVQDGATAGTTGESRRMEALQIDFQCS